MSNFFYSCKAGSGDNSKVVSNFVFFPGTEPFGHGSQRCRRFVISDIQLQGPMKICGRSTSSVHFLNNGCADLIGVNSSKIF